MTWKRTKTLAFCGLVIVLALWVNAGFAQEIDMTQDGWVFNLPASNYGPYETAGMGPDASYQGGYEAEIAEACAYYGCDPGYVTNVMYCESGGDHGAVAYNPSSGNYTYGIFQIDGMWGGGGMTPTEQIWFAAEHLTAGDIWWACPV